jgi:hypothetical protein
MIIVTCAGAVFTGNSAPQPRQFRSRTPATERPPAGRSNPGVVTLCTQSGERDHTIRYLCNTLDEVAMTIGTGSRGSVGQTLRGPLIGRQGRGEPPRLGRLQRRSRV